jgi:hypothetical protein
LLTYLYLRLIGANDTRTQWRAHSVDPVDVPAFFLDYCGPRLSVWLDSLSQAANGEYDPRSAQPIAAHTDLASEAPASHRLILASRRIGPGSGRRIFAEMLPGLGCPAARG